MLVTDPPNNISQLFNSELEPFFPNFLDFDIYFIVR